ncbi:MAG: recombination protein RecR [Planctomycetes bacterium]|nr:recombination protein RecR [Planctomycetota bacterium]
MGTATPIVRLMKALSRLPGIGEKTAERLAFFIHAQSQSDALDLADAIREVKERLRSCSLCYDMTIEDPCAICSDAKRDRALVCVVEQSKDLGAIEKAGAYRGLYHVLNGHLSPLDGIGPEQLTIRPLVERVRKGGVDEVILATNPTAEGDATAFYVQKALTPLGAKVTRIARGLPAGSSFEYASRTIVADALKGRREF